MSPSAYASRQARLAQALLASGASAYFAATKGTMGWLAGLGEEGGERLLTLGLSRSGQTRLIAPALAAAQARRHGLEDIRAWRDGEDPLLHLRELGRDWGLEGEVILLDNDAPAYLVFALEEAIPGARVQLGHEARTEVMMVKEEWELDLMARSGAIADQAFQDLLSSLKPGMTEKEAADILFSSMLGKGGSPTFAIVATGPGSAEPHHETGAIEIKRGDVLILDFGCTLEGYHSDTTRTVAVGEPDPEADRVYQAVLEAHLAARRAIHPGVPYQDLDRAARKVISEAGYGEFFTHRTGHGIGLNIHEAPNVVEGEARPLVPGACFSIEPGVYLEGRFGIRIENIVGVTADGHRSFNSEPPATLIRV